MSIPFMQRLSEGNPLRQFFGEFMPAPAPDIHDEAYAPKVLDIVAHGGKFIVEVDDTSGEFVMTVQHGNHTAAEVRLAGGLGDGNYSDEKENAIDNGLKQLVDKAEAHFASGE